MLKNRAALGKPASLWVFLVLLLVLLLGACGGLNRSDKPASSTWWLEPYIGPGPDSPVEQVVRLELSVTVVPGLDSHRILTLSDKAEVNKFSSARWAESLPELFESLVSRSLEASGQYQIVSQGQESEDCRLDLELQEFFAKLDPVGKTVSVQVAVSGRYQCDDSRSEIVQMDVVIPVREDRMSEVIVAFQASIDSVMQSLIDQL